MARMGRRRSTNHGLPPHMARKGQSYYHVGNGEHRLWTGLGNDYPRALTEWAKLEGEPVPMVAGLFGQVSALYMVEVDKGTFGNSLRTKKDKARDVKRLNAVFAESPMETILPGDVRKYITHRVVERGARKGEPATVRANREAALLSHIFNWARGESIYHGANPCAGILKNHEDGRERYLEDHEFDVIYAAGDELLRDAMDLLSSTSQRPTDVTRMKRTDERDGALWGRQGKTGTRQRFQLEGDLQAAIDRMKNRPRTATGIYLIQDDAGQGLTYWQLEDRWSKARAIAALTVPSVADAQMRDIRGKTATDLEDLAHAQELLGHKTRAMTERYVKQRAGTRVKPHSRKRRA